MRAPAAASLMLALGLVPILATSACNAADPAANSAITLDATSVNGKAEQASTDYKVEKAASQKYTAPLVDTPRSVTVIPQQVIKDTNALQYTREVAQRDGGLHSDSRMMLP